MLFNHVVHECGSFFWCNFIRIDPFCLSVPLQLVIDDILSYLRKYYKNLAYHENQYCLVIAHTSLIDPCPQMVIAGKAMSDMGLAVVLRVVIVGSSCQASYA